MNSNNLHSFTILFLLGCLLGSIQSVSAQAQSISEKERIEAQSAYVDGLAAFENENYQQALELLKKAYVKLDDKPGVNFALADTYLQLGDLANAEYYGKQAVSLDRQNLWYRQKLISIYREAGNTEAAISELNKALEYYPRETDLIRELATIYNNNGSLEKANELYNKLLYLRGEEINIRLQKLRNFNQMNMRDSAIVELEKIRDLDPDNLSTLQLLSKYYLEMDRLNDAREVLRQARKINRTDPQILIMLSDIYIAESKWDSVGTSLSRVVDDADISPEAKEKVARYLFAKYKEDSQNTNIQRATSTVFEQILQSDTKSSQLLNLVADFFSQTQQQEKALQALERTTEIIPTDDTAWKQRLQILLQNGQYQEAIAVGKQAAEEIPQDPIVLYFLGSAYLSNQNHAKAIEQLEAASKLPARRPLKASIYSGLGSAYAGLEEWDQSFKNFDQALTIDGDNASALNNYAYYLADLDRDLEKAEKMAKKALSVDPNNASYLDTLGWIYYQQEEYQEAQKYIQKALDSGQPSAEIMEHMGDVLDKLGQPQQAKSWWRKALEKDSTRTHLKDKISR